MQPCGGVAAPGLQHQGAQLRPAGVGVVHGRAAQRGEAARGRHPVRRGQLLEGRLQCKAQLWSILKPRGRLQCTAGRTSTQARVMSVL
jgi:hypothetical protein